MPDALAPHPTRGGQGPDQGVAGTTQRAQGPLWMQAAGGGFGFPHLYSRMQLRHVQGYLRAMDLRSVLVRENVRALSHTDHWKGMDGLDQERLLHTMAETHLEVHVLQAATAHPAAADTRVYRPYGCGGFLLERMARWSPRRTATPW